MSSKFTGPTMPRKATRLGRTAAGLRFGLAAVAALLALAYSCVGALPLFLGAAALCLTPAVLLWLAPRSRLILGASVLEAGFFAVLNVETVRLYGGDPSWIVGRTSSLVRCAA